MLPKPESACFVIADISGYTSFLAGVELDHAQDIIAGGSLPDPARPRTMTYQPSVVNASGKVENELPQNDENNEACRLRSGIRPRL
jgi:hypothetical protein